MEEKQFNQLFDLITRCVTGIRELQEGQKRLEEGQARMEKELLTTNRALDTLAGESIRVKARVDVLEQELSN
jgi:hypothetical protein